MQFRTTLSASATLIVALAMNPSAQAAQWQRIADFDDGTYGGTVVVDQGVDTQVTLEDGYAVLQPLTDAFQGGLDIKRRFAKKAMGVRVSALVENCDDVAVYNLDIIANVGRFANDSAMRTATASFQRNTEWMDPGTAYGFMTTGRFDPDADDPIYLEEAGGSAVRSYTDGAKIKLVLTYDRVKTVTMAGKKMPAVTATLRGKSTERLALEEEVISIIPYSQTQGSCRIKIDYVDVLLP